MGSELRTVSSIRTRSSLGRFEAGDRVGGDRPDRAHRRAPGGHLEPEPAHPAPPAFPTFGARSPGPWRVLTRRWSPTCSWPSTRRSATPSATARGAGDPVLDMVKADGEWIEMSVHDSGPTPRLPRLPAEPPPLIQTGGRGLWLILQLVDEVRLQRIDEGTRLIVRRRVAQVDSLVGPDGAVDELGRVATSEPPTPSPLVLLDGHSLAYRAFFALPSDLQTTTGQLTNVVYGFTTMLVKLFGDFSPDRGLLRPGPARLPPRRLRRLQGQPPDHPRRLQLPDAAGPRGAGRPAHPGGRGRRLRGRRPDRHPGRGRSLPVLVVTGTTSS